MRRLVASCWILLLVILWLPGCASTDLASSSSTAPGYTRSADHYLGLPDADALAAYLRADSDAGPLVSAHRGGPMPAYPENALETFEHTLRYTPALIECDVRMTRDSVLVLMHDDTLDRTTTGRGAVAAHRFADLRTLLLVDNLGIRTPFRIPTLDETLAWAEGRAILTLDVKQGVPIARVINAVRRLGAEERVVVITYTLDDLLRYHRQAPDLMLSASATTLEETQALLDSGVDRSRLIAFTGVGEVHSEVIDLLHVHHIRAILGTFDLVDARARQTGPEVFQALIDRGIDVIATDEVPLAAQALRAYALTQVP